MDPPVQMNAFVWEARPGQLSLTIACALAFRLQHGAEAHPVEPLRFYDDEVGAAFGANLRAPYKPRADLVVYGHACADARGPEVESLVVGVRFAEFAKSVRVTGDRVWLRDGQRIVASAPRPFRRLPISFERAARSAENPRGFDLDAAPAERRAALPNVERASQSQSALLGAVPPDAPQRANLLRTGASAHASTAFVRAVLAGQHAPPPPEGFPFQFFNLAPLDQQVEHIPWGAAIVLENLHPERALFSSRLPAVMPRGFVYDPHTQSHLEVEMRCDTLWIDADRETAILVCRGVTATSYADAPAHASVRVDPFLREERSNAMFETRIGALDRGSGLPFGRAAARDEAPRASAPTFGAPPSARADLDVTTRMANLNPAARPVDEATHAREPSLPRSPTLTIGQQKVGPPPRPGESGAPPPANRKAFITQEIDLAGPIAATPFVAASPEPGRVASSTPEPGTPASPPLEPGSGTLASSAPEQGRLEDPPTRAREPATRASVHTFDDVDNESSADTPTQPPRPVEGAVLGMTGANRARPVEPAEQPTRQVDIQGAAPSIQTRRLKPPDIPPTPPPPLPPKPGAESAAPAARALPPDTPTPGPRVAPPARVHLPGPGSAPARLGALKLGNAQLKGAGLMLANAADAIRSEKAPAMPASTAGEITTDGSTSEPTPLPPPPVITAPSLAASRGEKVSLAQKDAPAEAPRGLRDEHTDTSAGITMKPVEARTLEEAEAEADRDVFEFPLPKSDGHEVEGVTLEHCAAIRAAMAMPGNDRSAVLAKNDLDDATWARIEKAHMARIDQETSKGVMDLLSRYDAAYVAAQDKLRRPIGVKEYARILLARERGDLADAMTELGVPRSELMRLDRVWKQRRAAYPDVDKAIVAQVAAQKSGPRGG